VGRAGGVTADQLADMARFEESDAFSAEEKLVLRLAVALTATPVAVDDGLFAELHRRFDEPQLVELSATIAWENYRARFNRAFDVAPQGFSEGAACLVPERARSPRGA
jgi:alkylhydroperoxidase family enzyme